MAEAVVSFALERIGDLLIEKAKQLGGVTKQVHQLQVELNRMRCFLKDADRKQYDDDSVRNWVSEIRDLAYDAEAVIDAQIARPSNFLNKGTRSLKAARDIEAIRTKIADLTRSLQSYGLDSAKQGERQKQLRCSYSHLVEDFIVGFEENIKDLVEQLVDEQRNCKLVSICGMGGLGKTTLAKQVYFHGDVRRHFDGFAWAYVSQQCRRRDVWQGVLLSLVNPSKEERDEIVKMTDEEIAKKLYHVQKEKRCIVVLDDIWSIESWNDLSPAFPVRKGASKIVLTTRNKEVALHVDPGGFLHEPKCLTDEESWELFRRKVFLGQDDADIELNKEKEKLGRDMVKKCAGLPLAIIVIGGILAAKETLEEWEVVQRNIISYLRRSKGHDHNSTISEVLALSYHELPYQLKPCFLYFGHFPEDHEIPVKKLIRLWLVEGIVSSLQSEIEGEETMEDLAQQYISILISRCMVQVGQRGSTGNIKTYRLHDLMHDLCLSKATEENFLHIVGRGQGSVSSSTGRIRRLSVFSEHYVHGFVPPAITISKSRHLRSLLYFPEKKQRIEDWKLLKRAFANFKLFKILDLEGIKGLKGTFPKEIGSLIQLRFLSLKKTHIREIPSSIGKLRYLQTLDLRTVSKVSWESTTQVPNVINKMEQLRHLYLPKWCGNVTDKLNLANLSSLQTLVNFPADKSDVKDLILLTNLKRLVLNEPRQFQKFVDIFRPNDNKLGCLKSLSLKTDTLSFPDVIIDLTMLLHGCPSLNKLQVEGRIEMLPEHLRFPRNLTKLTLWGSRLAEDPMPILEKLPNLRHLSVWEVFTGSKMVCAKNGFRELRTLLMRGLPNLEEWTVEEGAMSKVSCLGISDCNRLKRTPDGFMHLTSLSQLEFRWMATTFKKRLQREGDDFSKVEHVPSIVFLN